MKAMQAELNRLKAGIRRTTEEGDIQKRPLRTSQNSPSEVRFYLGVPGRVFFEWDYAECWMPTAVACLAVEVVVAKNNGEPSPERAD